MSMYHVKSDGAMGVCKAQEGHCPFGGDSGTRHFTSESEAQAYAEELIRDTTDYNGGMKKMTKNSNGLAVTTYPPSEHGVHEAVYSGWECDDVIISAGGYVNGEYISPSEVWGLAGLWDRLSDEVQAEMPMPDGYPGEWNDKILELKQEGKLSDEDEELLDALWVSGEVCEGSVTIYGTDADVSEMDEDDLERLGLDRVPTEDEDEDEDEESPTIPTTDDDEPRMTKNQWGLNVTTWPPTEKGCHSATYLGWGGDDDYEIVHAGGWVDGEYVPSHEVFSAGLYDRGLYDRLSEDVREEMDSLDGQGTGGATPVEWNDKILELARRGVSPEDEALLDALWIEGESFNGSVTIYGVDNDVSEMDEDDFRRLGLRRLDADALWHMGIVDDDDDATEDEDE